MKYPVLFALLVAVCWGLYGPTLSQSRSALGSPFKPYVMIGVAYVFWAIGGGILGMLYKGDNFSFTGPGAGPGVIWGFAAGTLGALGALNLTLAMFSGGAAMPQVVMPIVFGGAVTIASFVSVYQTRGVVETSPWLWVGVVGIFVSILLVAYNTPEAPHKPPSSEPTAESESH